MNNIAKEIINISLEKEIKYSYINYAMSVIIGRALPDVRDGLKPVHRRILYAMFLLNNYHNKPYKKSARIVGDVIGKFHPHGDNAVYETIVRMVQSFIIRYPLIDGQGNFGSIDGDAAAAMRYTEIKMSKISYELLSDIGNNTVPFIKNYDNTELIPTILPTKIPNLLINGSSGIAVGMTTNIPPHNFKEIINGCLEYINNPNITINKLMNFIFGPDFPTGGILYNKDEIKKIYLYGKGKIHLRMKYKIKVNKYKNNKILIIYEIPYLINKSKLIIRINELIKNNKLEGINKLKDESDKDGLRIKIEIKTNYSIKNIINNLYLLTPLQSSININMVALINNQPKLMNLKELISYYINFRCEIIIKKFIFLLNKYKNKFHNLEGLLIIINNLNLVIKIIKYSKNIKYAIDKLSKIKFKGLLFKKKILNYNLTIIQIKTILNLKLQQLTNIEQNNILIKYKKLLNKIKFVSKIIYNHNNLMNYIKNELITLKNKFYDKRRTIISNNNIKINNEIIINKKPIFIILTIKKFIKYYYLDNLKLHKRGNKIKYIIKLSKLDKIYKIILTNTHKYLLFLSNLGKIYKLKIYNIIHDNNNLDKYIHNYLLLNNLKFEYICNIIEINNNLNKNNKKYYLIIITILGIIKKLILSKNILNLKNKGLLILNLHLKDKIVNGIITNGLNEIMIFTANGKVLRFHEKLIKSLNRNAYGNKGIKLSLNDKVKSILSINNTDEQILIITENGYGKRIYINNFNLQSKGLKGVLGLPINKKKGILIKAIKINNEDKILIITNLGYIFNLKAHDIPLLKRTNQTRIIIKLKRKEKIIDIQKINN